MCPPGLQNYKITAVCDKSGCGHAAAGRCRAHALVYRKHALGAGRQSAAGPDQAPLRQSSSKSRHDPHRIVHSIFSIWKRLRKKRADRRKGMAEIMRHVSANFTKLIRFLCQKWKKQDFDRKIINLYTTQKNTRLSVEPGKGLYSLSTSLNERAV